MPAQLLMVRHPPVALAWHGVCYGSTDAPLGDAGLATIPGVVAEVLTHGPITMLVHSGLSRSSAVAEAIGDAARIAPVVDRRVRERCFGRWEGRTWDEIHAESGAAMLGMIHDPERWRPPGGETTFELRDRIMDWFAALPDRGRVVVVTHGGPIAALCGTLAAAPVERWPEFIPACGAVVVVDASRRGC